VHVRTVVVALLLGAGSLLVAGAPASAQQGTGCGSASSTFGCSGDGGDQGGGSETGSDGGSGGGPPVDYEIFVDEDGTPVNPTPGNQGCWAIRAVPAGEGLSYEEALADQQLQGENGVLWGICEGQEAIDPAYLAQMYWEQQAAPPPPTPLTVNSGYGTITGLTAYLEIGGEVPATQSFGTPIGTLTFTMTPRYVVSWGDGSSTETTSQGGPHPGGDVTHIYVDEGGVTVTVAAYWHATWTLAGAGGDLPELPVPTEAALDLPVEEYQAVIDPN
jgi:hypothetical protein